MNNKIIFLFIIFILLLFTYNSYKNDNNDKNDNIIYIPNFLNHQDFTQMIKLDKDKNNFIYEQFRYTKPLHDRFVYDIFYSTHYINKLRNYLTTDIFASDFPIEHRFYHKESPGMRWHTDTLLYEKPQYEAIYTINNQSGSMTQWQGEDGEMNELWTEPNSLLVVKAGGYKHRVTPMVSGEREILKLIYTPTHNTNENFHKEMIRFNKFKM